MTNRDIRQMIYNALAEQDISLYRLGELAEAQGICTTDMVYKYLKGSRNMEYNRLVGLAGLLGIQINITKK